MPGQYYHGNNIFLRAELHARWAAVSEECVVAKDDLETKSSQLTNFQEKTEELSDWLGGIREKVDEFDPNQVSLPSALQEDMRAMKVR